MNFLQFLNTLSIDENTKQQIINNYNQEMGNYIPRDRFNEVNNQLKKQTEELTNRDQQLETLRKSSETTESLKKTIQELEETNKRNKEESDKRLLAERKNNALRMELIQSAKDVDIVISQLNQEKIEVNSEGKIIGGLKEQLENLKATKSFLFNDETDVQPDNKKNVIIGRTPINSNSPLNGGKSANVLEEETLDKFIEDLATQSIHNVDTENPYFK